MKPRSAKNKYKQTTTAIDYLKPRTKKLKSGCWKFTGPLDKDGYGQVQSTTCAKTLKVTRAHQLAYVAQNGLISKGKCICHTCDNPSCINPEHLFLGTIQDNNLDKVNKNRQFRGPSYKARKIDYEKILARKGENGMKVAKEFGISFSRVYQLWRGEYASKKL